eukprot:g13933.t1
MASTRTRVDFLALVLAAVADLHGTRARTFEAQEVQPSTAVPAVSLPFASGTSGGFSLRLYSSPGVVETETQGYGVPKAPPRPRSLNPAAEEQEHVPLVAEDVSFGARKGAWKRDGGEKGESGPLVEGVDNVRGDVDTQLRRLRGVASQFPADGDADAGAITEAAKLGRGDFATLRGQCDDGDSFTVTSGGLPIADGCYSAIVGTDFGEGFFYSTDEEDKRLVYPKLITRDGESKYFWAAAAFGDFSGGTNPIDCLSVEPTSTYIHPAAATWQCDLDGSGALERITDEEFFVVCGCGDTATSGSSSIGSAFTPAPSGTTTNAPSGAETFTTIPTTAPSGRDPDAPINTINSSAAPTTIPTPAASTILSPPSATSPPVTERDIIDSGCSLRTARSGSLAALSLGASVFAPFIARFGASFL